MTKTCLPYSEEPLGRTYQDEYESIPDKYDPTAQRATRYDRVHTVGFFGDKWTNQNYSEYQQIYKTQLIRSQSVWNGPYLKFFLVKAKRLAKNV